MIKSMKQMMINKIAYLGFILILGITANSAVFAQEFARPDSTVLAGGFTSSSSSQLWEDLDEITANTTDYIISLSTGDEAHLGLSGVPNPNSSDNHIMRVHFRGAAKAAQTIQIGLYKDSGSTLIATLSNVSVSKNQWYTRTYTLSAAEANNITNYSDLSIKVNNNFAGDRDLYVSWFEFEVPTSIVLAAPTVTVQTASAIGTRSATLNGTVTVNGSAADNDTYFEYGTSSGPPYDTTTGTVSTIATGSFTLPVTGLEPSTLYYYRACATANEAGGLTGCSSETTFTTDPLTAPTVSVQPATAIDTNGATLHGTITANGSAVDNNTYFKYGTTTGVYTVTTGSAGTITTGAFQLAVTGLDPSTTYYYIACATANESGGLEGCSAGEQSFTTNAALTAPTVTVQPATAIGIRGATLNGTVTVNGSAADNDTYFKYGTSNGGPYDTTTASAGTVTTGSFSLAVTGLDPNTTYYYIACATANEPGGLEGCSAAEQSFTTDPLTAPTVTVQPATAIGTNGATLHGTVTVNGSAATNNTYFKYGTSSGVYTVTTGSAGSVATGAFSLAVTGLNPNTTYYYIACATANETGGLEGCSPAEESFTTDKLAPTVTVQPATGIGAFGATLNGNVTVNGSATDNDTYFKYGTSSGVYTFTTGSAGTVTTGAFSLAVTGLDPSSTYYYIACATANEVGGLEGCSAGEQSFTTTADLTAPTVTVQPATAIGTNGTTLHGTVTVNGSATDNNTYFKYGTSTGTYTVTTASAGSVATGAFSLGITGLNPNTTYYYIACATANEPGGLEGCSSGEQSFTTLKLAPTVTVQPATSIGSRTATLNGTVTVNGSAADNNTYFKYGTSSGVYTVTTGSAGTVATGTFSLGVTGLDPSTTYYYIACATANEAGGLEGCSASEETFTTEPLTAPTVTVQAATGIGTNGATLRGTVTVNGSATNNDTYFKYGTSSGVYTVTTASAGTVTTGAFSLAVTGLNPDTTYYYIACATANESGGLEGCSAGEESFITVANVSQPTNLWFHNIGSTAMTLYWTEGIGDGSIVVMKQGSAVSATPTDGVEHLADSVFGSGADLGGGNFVVYRGTGEAVHVTGLTQGLTYHAAVYTYTGAGALIEYLLPGPAIGNETTSTNTPHNVAVLNVDDTVGCTSGCHGFHGSPLIPRGTDQETMCVTCHNPAGMPGALDKLNFSLHTNSKGNPPGSPGVVDCGSCHELHNPGTVSSTYSQHPITSTWDYNLYYLRANADKYVPTALASDLVMHDTTEWAFEDGAAYEGACQICHTNTTAYDNTPSAGDIHQGGDLGDVNCKGCHDHGGGFAGAGGDCTACHNSIQDKDGVGGNPGRRIVTTEFSGGSIASSHLPGTLDAADCEVCHDQSSHQAGQVKLKDPDGGTSITLGAYASPTEPGGSADAALLTNFCKGCHDLDGATSSFIGASATSPFTTSGTTVDINADWTNSSHNAGSSVSCLGDGEFGCHSSGHGSMKLTMLAPFDVAPIAPANTEEQEGFCFNCHDADGPSQYDIESQINSGTNWTAYSTAVSKNPKGEHNQRHDVLWADQDAFGSAIECTSCHLPHKDNSADANTGVVSHPDDGSKLVDYNPANYTAGELPTFDPTNPIGCNPANGTPHVDCETVPGRIEPDYIEFCNACHDGGPTYPSGVVMKPLILNMVTSYETDQHGKGQQNQEGKGTLKPPWVTTLGDDYLGGYAALNCTICHGPHGSVNIYNLRESIMVAGVQMEIGGESGSGFDTFSGTTYTLPGTPQEDHKWGAWCTFCHELSGHTSYNEGTTCTDAHKHGASNF